MPNNEIIVTTIISLATWFIASFARLIFNRIFDTYIPERKKLISYVRKALFFMAAYIFPIAWITRLMIVTTVVDKFFVLGIALSFFGLAVNFGVYLQSNYREYILKTTDLMTGQWRSLADLQKLFHERISKIEDELATKRDK